jgi:sec-independent protein translocase protein TatA
MGGLSVWHWLIFLAVALLLFGGSGKISSIMGDVAKGIKSFKKGMSEDDEAKKDDPFKKDEPPKSIEATAAKPVQTAATAETKKAG